MPELKITQAREAPNARFGKGASATEIRDAECKFGVRFPNSFRAFLRELGYYESPELSVHGLGKDVPRHCDLVWIAQSEIEGWKQIVPMPEGFIPFSPDARGGMYGLETRKTKDGECPVALWDHELVNPDYKPRMVARSFGGFFNRELPAKHRPLPPVSLENAMKLLKREAKRFGWVHLGPSKDPAKVTGAPYGAIAEAERSMRLKFPPEYRRVLREVDGLEIGCGTLFGVRRLQFREHRVTWWRNRLVRSDRRWKRYLPIALTCVPHLACIDLDDPPRVVSFDVETLKKTAGRTSVTFDRFIYYLSLGDDPWDPLP